MSKYLTFILLALAVMLMLAASGADGWKHGHKIVKRAAKKKSPAKKAAPRSGDAGALGTGADAGISWVIQSRRKFRKVETTTHEPEMTEEQEEEEVRDIDINVGLDAILALPNSKAPKPIKDGINKLVKYSDPLQSFIQKALGMVSKELKPGIDMIISFIQNLLKLVSGSALKIKKEIDGSLKEVLDFLLKGKGTLGGLILSTIGRLNKVAKLMAQQVLAFANFLIGGLQKILGLIMRTLIFKFTITANIIMDIIKNLLGMISGGNGQLTDAMENVLETKEGTKMDFLGGLRALIGFATKAVSPLISHFVNLIGTFGAILGPILNPIIGAIFSVVKGLTLVG